VGEEVQRHGDHEARFKVASRSSVIAFKRKYGLVCKTLRLDYQLEKCTKAIKSGDMALLSAIFGPWLHDVPRR